MFAKQEQLFFPYRSQLLLISAFFAHSELRVVFASRRVVCTIFRSGPKFRASQRGMAYSGRAHYLMVVLHMLFLKAKGQSRKDAAPV